VEGRLSSMKKRPPGTTRAGLPALGAPVHTCTRRALGLKAARGPFPDINGARRPGVAALEVPSKRSRSSSTARNSVPPRHVKLYRVLVVRKQIWKHFLCKKAPWLARNVHVSLRNAVVRDCCRKDARKSDQDHPSANHPQGNQDEDGDDEQI
jgi:hypothetical protein